MKKLKQSLIILLTIVLIISVAVFFGGCAGGMVECICEDDCYGACNFELIVEVESLVLEANYTAWGGRRVYAGVPNVTVTLTNISDRNITIAAQNAARTYVVFMLRAAGEWGPGPGPIVTWPPGPPSPPRWSWVSGNLESGEYISRQPFYTRYGFGLGKHEALITVGFYINHRSRSRQNIRFSYTFMFEVI